MNNYLAAGSRHAGCSTVILIDFSVFDIKRIFKRIFQTIYN